MLTSNNVFHVTCSFGGGLQQAILGLKRIRTSDVFIRIGVRSRFVTAGVDTVEQKSLIGFLSMVWKQRGENCDYIFCFHSDLAGLLRFAVKFCLPKATIIFMPHCFFFQTQSGFSKSFWFFLEKISSLVTDRYLCLNSCEMEYAALLGADSIVRVRNADNYDLSSLHYDKNKSPLTEVVSVGRICRQKGVVEAVKFAEAFVRDSSITATWVGVGERRLTARLLKAGWLVTGWLEKSEVANRVKAAKLSIMFSIAEGFPFVFVESLSAGTPVLFLDAPWNAEFPNSWKFKDPSELMIRVTRSNLQDLFLEQALYLRNVESSLPICEVWAHALEKSD